MSAKLSNRLNPALQPCTLKPQKGLTRFSKKPLHKATTQVLTLGMAVSLSSTPVWAESEQPGNLDTIEVIDSKPYDNPYAEEGAPYKANESGDPRHVKPIAETPQTIQVLTQAQIQDSGKSDLKEILQAQPGITLGTGENGNAFGDRYIIRGHEARSDVFVDGLRDPGMTTRESFATEQIEITKGPSSTFAGRGSTGGAVNSVTKQANLGRNFNKLSGGWGSDDYHRYTLDSNVKLTDDAAVRVNVLNAYEEVPDRAPADRERNGVAGSLFWAPTDKLDFTLDHYYLKANDSPDLGSYIDSETGPNNSLPAYLQNRDFLDSTVNTTTFKVGYQASNNVRIENATRYGTADNGYVVTGARGRETDASDPNGVYSTVALSTHQGWQEVDYFANAFNVFYDTKIADMRHQFVFTGEYSDHRVLNGVYNVNNAGATNCTLPGRGSSPASGGYCIQNPDGSYVSGINDLMARQVSKGDWDSDWHMKTTSVAAMDTVDVTRDFTVFGGVRYDAFDLRLKTQGRSSGDYKYSDGLWNGHFGVVYDVAKNGNVYASISTAANINGGESDVGTNAGYGGLIDAADSEPETTQSIELGTKWQLNNNKLLATAAVFQITKDNVMESARGEDYSNSGTPNTGKNRVQGIELGLVGNLTDRLSGQLSYTRMKAEVLKSSTPENEGKTLSNFADNQAYALLKYALTPKFSFGGSATYSSEMYAGQPDTAAGENIKIPSYTVYDAFANYRFTRRLDMQLNVGNLTDEDYYLAAYRSGSFAYKGDARNYRVTLNYEF